MLHKFFKKEHVSAKCHIPMHLVLAPVGLLVHLLTPAHTSVDVTRYISIQNVLAAAHITRTPQIHYNPQLQLATTTLQQQQHYSNNKNKIYNITDLLAF